MDIDLTVLVCHFIQQSQKREMGNVSNTDHGCQKVKAAKTFRMPQKILRTDSLITEASEYTGSVAWQKIDKSMIWGLHKGRTERGGMKEEIEEESENIFSL